MRATWDSESDSKEEVDMTNVHIIANENTPKIFSKPYLGDCDLTMEELEKVFEELSYNYDSIKKNI